MPFGADDRRREGRLDGAVSPFDRDKILNEGCAVGVWNEVEPVLPSPMEYCRFGPGLGKERLLGEPKRDVVERAAHGRPLEYGGSFRVIRLSLKRSEKLRLDPGRNMPGEEGNRVVVAAGGIDGSNGTYDSGRCRPGVHGSGA